ncbi:hypothetical protein ACW9HQ_25080 [Nocardia gipuzkoensis]
MTPQSPVGGELLERRFTRLPSMEASSFGHRNIVPAPASTRVPSASAAFGAGLAQALMDIDADGDGRRVRLADLVVRCAAGHGAGRRRGWRGGERQ